MTGAELEGEETAAMVAVMKADDWRHQADAAVGLLPLRKKQKPQYQRQIPELTVAQYGRILRATR